MSLQQPGVNTAKLSVAAYSGALASPQNVLVLTYRISIAKGALCPTVPLYAKSHYDSWSQFGAAVQLSENGKVLGVGAPEAKDVNGDNIVGAVYLYDVSIDTAMSATQFISQITNNGVAGCAGGFDANGNPCTNAPEQPTVTCKTGFTLLNAAGQKIMISQAGEQVPCQDPAPSFWQTPASTPLQQSTVSGLTTINPSVKGGVGVPVGQISWAPMTSMASLGSTGAPAPATTNTASFTPSVVAAGGGIPRATGPANAAQAQAAAAMGFSIVQALLGGGGLPGGLPGAAPGTGSAAIPGLPVGAVITG
jgi:hypothetical protein